MNIEELIRNLLKEMMPVFNRRAVIFLSGGSVNAEILLKLLTDFQFNHCDIVMTESARAIMNEASIANLNGHMVHTHQELEEAITACDLILIPILTRNTLSKVSLGIADNLVTTGIARAIMMKKEIIAVRDSYHPKNAINIVNELSKNDSYNEMLLTYERNLESFGLKIVDLSEFKVVVQNKLNGTIRESNKNENSVQQEIKLENINEEVINSSIISVADLKKYGNQKRIPIKTGAIITPLANDYIRTNEISLQFK